MQKLLNDFAEVIHLSHNQIRELNVAVANCLLEFCENFTIQQSRLRTVGRTETFNHYDTFLTERLLINICRQVVHHPKVKTMNMHGSLKWRTVCPFLDYSGTIIQSRGIILSYILSSTRNLTFPLKEKDFPFLSHFREF